MTGNDRVTRQDPPLRSRLRSFLAAGALLTSSGVPPVAYAQITIDVTVVTDGIHMLAGRGGNVGVLTGGDGTFMIDDQFAPVSEQLLSAIRSVGGDQPRFLLNTHFHGDHTGGNENFAKPGTTIVSHHNVRKRLAQGTTIAEFDLTTPPAPESALPELTYGSDMRLHLNGQRIDVFHVPAAHTDGDSIVHFPDADVIHAGDTFFNGFFPFIDTAHGGTVSGTIAAANRMLALSGPDTRIIPGHGPLASPADLRAYRDMLETARMRLSKLKAKGMTAQAAADAEPLADLDEAWGKAMFSARKWISLIYDGI